MILSYQQNIKSALHRWMLLMQKLVSRYVIDAAAVLIKLDALDDSKLCTLHDDTFESKVSIGVEMTVRSAGELNGDRLRVLSFIPLFIDNSFS